MRVPFLVRFWPKSLFGGVCFPGGPQLPGLEQVALMEEKAESAPPARTRKLIARAQQGDERAFESLYRQHRQRVYSLCLWVLGDQSEAENFTQDAFLRTFRKISTFSSDGAFSTLLYRTTMQLVVGRLREDPSWQYPLGAIAPVGEDQEREAENSAASDRLPITRTRLEKAVRQLPASCRFVFVLHDIFGYQDDEIAAWLECPREGSKSQLQQARMRMRVLLCGVDCSTNPQAAGTLLRHEEQVR